MSGENTHLLVQLHDPGPIGGERRDYDSTGNASRRIAEQDEKSYRVRRSFGGEGELEMVGVESGDGDNTCDTCKHYTWELLQRACWIMVGLPLIIILGGASSYFMGAFSTVDLYRYVFPLDAMSNHWLVLGVVIFSTIIASIGCVVWMGLMACVWTYTLSSMRALYSIFAFIGVMGAGQFGMSAAQQFALGDAQVGPTYFNVSAPTPPSVVADAAAIYFKKDAKPYGKFGSSSWAPDLNYATQICVSPILKNENQKKACYWAVDFGTNPTRGCSLPNACLGATCKGTTAEAKQYKYYVDDAIRKSVTHGSRFEPCETYVSVLLREDVDLPALRQQAYQLGRMWLLGGFVAALIMSVCLSILCRRVVWSGPP